MEIKGKIIQVMPVVKGMKKDGSGEWSKQPFVIETNEQYPKRVYIEMFGSERIAQNPILVGNDITAQIEVSSREYNGRWYTGVLALSVKHEAEMSQTPISYDLPY